MSQFIFGPPSSAVDDQKGVANGIASLNSTGKVPSSQLDNMTGATSSTDGAAGLVPAPQSADAEKFLRGDGTWQDGGKPMVVLTYGSSTWNDFINAYNDNIIVYTRVSGRMAFMAYVNNASNPSEVEFQYYRSLSSHSATAQTDEVYVYKLNKTSGWTTTTRKAGTALAAGTNMSLSYASDVVTLNSTLENKAAASEGTDVSLVTTGEKYAWNNKVDADELDKKADIAYEWMTKTWTGLTSFVGNYVWTDGTNIYYSSGYDQYILDKSTSIWSTKTWTGLTVIYGQYIWTDGTDIYYSSGTTQYVLDKSTSTWSTKTWTGLTNFYGNNIWTDGTNIYHSNGTSQYVLNKSTSTWSAKTWNGMTNFYGSYIWTDGTDIYYSANYDMYVLNKSTSTWSTKIWIGLTGFNGNNVWTDGTNIYYSQNSAQYVLDKSTSTWSIKTWTGLSSFNGGYIWTDGTNYFYSYDSSQCALTIHSKLSDYIPVSYKGSANGVATLDSDGKVPGDQILGVTRIVPKTWIGLTSFNGQYIWTDGIDIYYSYSTTHYVLDKSTFTWSVKTWAGLTNFYGHQIWTDGIDIYFSNGSAQYVLDKSTSTWLTKTWTGLTSFYGQYIWTDGSNIYYSNNSSTQYVLDKSTSTWSTKTWKGFTGLIGQYVWTDGTNYYYSNSTNNQYVLDKSTSTWSTKKWTGLTNFVGQHVWTDGVNIYYSGGSSQYVLNKSASTWLAKEWTELASFSGINVWTDGTDIYYSDGSKQYQIIVPSNFTVIDSNGGLIDSGISVTDFVFKQDLSERDLLLEKVSNELNVKADIAYEWIHKEWTGLTSFTGNYVWTDGTDIYYSSGSDHYVLDKSTSTWSTKTWTGLTSFAGSYVWTDGTDIYYSYTTTQYVLDKSTSTWSAKTWDGMTSFEGNNVWTNGTDIYYSNNGANLVLNKSTSTWSTKTWTGYTNIRGSKVWTYKNDIYYSYNGINLVLDKSTSTWSYKTWTGITNMDSSYIWTDGVNVYYSAGITQYALDKSTSTWSTKTWPGFMNFYGYNVWTDGSNYFYSNNAEQYIFVVHTGLSDYIPVSDKGLANGVATLDSDGKVPSNQILGFTRITPKNWTGLTDFYGYNVWNDGSNIYYSYASQQYILDKSTSTWSTKTWTGLTNFYGTYIWTDGTDIYYSNTSQQYILDKSTSTWSTKTWTGLTSFDAHYVWTDGTDIYYSYNSDQYVLDKSSSTWSTKTWNGLTSFTGSDVWTDGTNIYYNTNYYPYVLDKSTSTWSIKNWNGLTNFSGGQVWTDGTDIYYSYNSDQYVLDKSTSTWSPKTWTGLTDFNGNAVWTDGNNIYYSKFDIQYEIIVPRNLAAIDNKGDLIDSGKSLADLISLSDLPEAGENQSGILTTGSQIISGHKFFKHLDSLGNYAAGLALRVREYEGVQGAMPPVIGNFSAFSQSSGKTKLYFNGYGRDTNTNKIINNVVESYELPEIDANRTTDATYKILTTKDSLDSTEKQEARTVIGAASSSDVSAISEQIAVRVLTSSEGIKTIALNATVCPENSVRWFNTRSSLASELPAANEYGIARVTKRLAGSCFIEMFTDAGIIWRNAYNGSTWSGWERLATNEHITVVSNNVLVLSRHTRKTDFSLSDLQAAVSEQNLAKYGLKPGDQKTINGHTYIIAGLNVMKGTHSNTCTSNHVGLIVIPHTTCKWNASGNTYTGANNRGEGYKNCDLQYYLANDVMQMVNTDLGSGHVYQHKKLFGSMINQTGYNRWGLNSGCTFGWQWVDAYISALTEAQVFGGDHWSSSGYDTGEANTLLPVFAEYKYTDVFGDEYPWLRNVSEATRACFAGSDGSASGAATVGAALSVAGLILYH